MLFTNANNRRLTSIIITLLALPQGGCAIGFLPPGTFDTSPPRQDSVKLKPSARIASDLIDESSALAACQRVPGIFWTLNDSGDSPRLFAISRDGQLVQPVDLKGDYAGLHIEGARNVDWESLTHDHNGHLYIADTGNNRNERRDLTIYKIPEPDPRSATRAAVSAAYRFRYPAQNAFPPPDNEKNFDCEAIFHALGNLYLLTKHRGDSTTILYRFDAPHPAEERPLRPIARFHIRGMVTGASASPDGRSLAILTYGAVWVFTSTFENPESWFAGETLWLPIEAAQCEAIEWIDQQTLLISNEQQNLFELPLSQLRPLSPPFQR